MAERAGLGVLGEIAARKRTDVAARLAGSDLADLRSRAEPSRLSLRAALARPGARFVMEVKRASPSQGRLSEAADPARIARAYRGAADAISVLTDTPYFGGSLADLEAVRAAYDGPILAKDFIVDPRQVPEARIHGADAVLAILALLSDAEARALIDEAARLGMDVLVETHDEAEIRRAAALGAVLIGINNRDLKTLEVDLAVTERLAGLVPAGALVVAESGIGDRAGVARLAPHADAFLVGSSLMRAPDPGLAARALAYGRVKIRGLADPEDARLAAAAGASFAGLIMVPGTPRAVGLDQAGEIARGVDIPAVGVFRNAKMMEVAAAAGALGLAAVQLHGEEDAAYLRGLRRMLPGGVEIWAAAAVGRDLPEPRLGADRTLYDSRVAGRSGGTGIAFDWSLLAGRDLSGAILAGGIGPDNAAAAARLGAWAIDVSSGVEAGPGRKDPDRLAALFEALRLPVRGDRPMLTRGRFGAYGGAYVPEILMPALEELEGAFVAAQADPGFRAELDGLLTKYAGRPTPLTRCRNLGSERARIYLKREDLLHGGAHKTNQVLAQALLARRMGKRRIIAETGAGQHGVATALAGALFGLETRIYMGALDVERQRLNVFRMRLMGAEVVPVESGGRTLKDAVNEALRDWTASFADTHYLLGTVAGPHPFPLMVREFQRVIGQEARAQILEEEGRLPDAVIACVGGGSNAMGMFADFVGDEQVRLIGLRLREGGLDGEEHGATLLRGRPGVLHGAETYVLQDQDGQITDTWSVSAGLDYPAVGPEHAFLKDLGRAEYVGATDREALDAFALLARSEGIVCAFESAHALAHGLKMAEAAAAGTILLVNLSGRGDKDMEQAQKLLDFRAVNDRYGAMFERLEEEQAGAFGAFVMLGDPDPATSGDILDALAQGGADMIEVAIPFSDPVADGPTIQAAGERALARGITPAACFEILAAFRRRNPHVPVGILTYANIVLARGMMDFYAAAAAAGVDSVLVADVPAFEAEPFAAAAKAAGVAPILIAAPNTPGPVLQRIAGLGQGYTYCVGRAGVTGAEREMRLQHDDLFRALARHDAPPPILGFGISRPEQVRMALAAGAAGVISGSAIVDLVARNPGGEAEAVRAFVAAMKAATRG